MIRKITLHLSLTMQNQAIRFVNYSRPSSNALQVAWDLKASSLEFVLEDASRIILAPCDQKSCNLFHVRKLGRNFSVGEPLHT